MPLIERLKKISDPYWREAITRTLMELWRELVRNKDEQTYYYDMDGYMCYSWADAEYDFGRIIRRCTAEQVEEENNKPAAPEPNAAIITENENLRLENYQQDSLRKAQNR